MLIIGCDYHPSVQQIAFVDTETGDCGEHRLKHSEGEAENFYRDLKLTGIHVRVGLEATEHTRWFERLLAELGLRVMDRRCGSDHYYARPEAENGPTRRRVSVEAVVGGSLSQSVGAQSGESGSAGTDANADHESAAIGRDERGLAA